MAAITPAAAVLGPIIVGAYVTDMLLSAQQAGYLIASELVGAGMATFVAFFAVGRYSWRHILRAALLVCLLGNLLSTLQTSFELLLAIRFVTGLAVGAIMTMTIVIVGMTRDQERNFGYWSAGQVIFAVIGFAIFPQVIPVVGIDGFFTGMAVVMALQQLLVQNLPASGRAEHQLGFSSLPPEAKRLAPGALLALLFFYIGIGSVWAYVERIGAQANFDPQYIGYALSGSSVIGVFGAAAATWMSTRFGRLLPSFLGYVMIGGAIAMYFDTQAAMIFVAASLLFKFAWWFITPYLLASMTTLDPSGRIAILTNFVIGFGLGVGPAIAAWLIGGGEAGAANLDYNKVIYLGLGCIVASMLMLVPVIRLNSVTQPESAAAETVNP